MTSSVLIPLDARNMCCDSRITSGAVAMSNIALTIETGSANFAGMNISDVVSATGGCCPSMNDSITSGDGHREFGIDTFDISPINGVAADGVNNFDSIISHNYVRAMHHEVNSTSNCCSDDESQYCCNSAAADNGFNNHKGEQKISNNRSDNSARGSKFFTINHVSSLTQGVKNV